ncbi:YbhB/YbcL family Raf kinase inhibitor-like protein [Nonomuraea typhae]|uniref:YbhB/YbcL family Raf kinase inhibitor-like protein n=1 Tax=Nonomuraea typhae TaxID=2603600 RepID=UPI001FEA69DC|nr:YbhB/YbcL family Raf kinase inhibitor-like protein [Nonomuraea typhae]
MGLRFTASRVRRAAVCLTAVAMSLAMTGCALLPGRSLARDIGQLNVTSPELREDKPLPREYSCKGNQGSPPLRWSGESLLEAKSIAIVLDTHTGSNAAVNWVVYNIPPDWTELGPNAAEALPDEDTGQAKVTSGKVGYEPPCDDKGTYRFSVYALDERVSVSGGAPLPEVLKSIADRTIARGRLTVVNIE